MNMSLLDSATTNPVDVGVKEARIQKFVGAVGTSLAAEKDHTISAGFMALSRVLFKFRSTIRYMRLTKVEANYHLVQMIPP